MTAGPTPTPAPAPAPTAAPGGTDGAVLGEVKFFQTNRLEPFRRIRVPGSHRFGSDQPDDDKPSLGAKIDGRGYNVGARSMEDYDKKIGKQIGQDISDTLAKLIPIYGAFRGLQAGLGALAKKVPVIGDKIAELIDDADPIKALLRYVGGEVDAMLVESLFHNVPAWVPVLRNATTAKGFEEQEVQGFLVRSHQRVDGVPFSQWHLWYDWSFVVAPVGDSFDLIGDGNRNRTAGDDKDMAKLQLDSRRYERHWMPPSANINNSIQCEWDLGAIGPPPLPDTSQASESGGGAFFNTGKLSRDWGWPMAGQYFWAGGRTVYDCRVTTSDDKAVGLHMNQLHPLKSIATARWEGVRFAENQQAVAALQFVFFASNARPSAGDFKFKTLKEVDYEFVVQLPEGGAGVVSDDPRAIGALPQFLLNTIDIGRRLLVSHTSEPFFEGTHKSCKGVGLAPVVTPVFTVRGRAPTHAHIKIPLTQIDERNFDNYGVVVSLGWHDPTGLLARDVFEVIVDFQAIEIHDPKENGTAEWFINFGANGRWFQRFLQFPASKNVTTLALKNARVTLFLHRDDAVQVACHGMEEDGEGDEYKLPIEENDPEKPPPDAPKSAFDKWIQDNLRGRKLRLSKGVDVPTAVDKTGNVTKREHVELPFVGDVVEWQKHVDQPTLPRTKEDNETASEVARALFLRTATYLFDANDILGLVDPNVFNPKQPFGRINDRSDTPNPLLVKDVIAKVGIGGTQQCQGTGYATTKIGRMGTLGYDEDPVDFKDNDPTERHPVKLDYVLRYSVTVRRQGGKEEPPPPPPIPPPPPPAPVDFEPSIVPSSVQVRTVPQPSIVPASVTVKPAASPGINPSSVTVRAAASPSIQPNSVKVTRKGP